MECLCFAIALIGPAVGGYLLRDRFEALAQVPISLWVPLIPPLLLFLAGIGFHRHRKGIERKLSAATEARSGS